MKIVLVKHFHCDAPFVFKSDIDLEKGDIVKCDTKYGVVNGICATNSVEVEDKDAKDIAKAMGGTKLKPITGKYIFYTSEFINNMSEVMDTLKEVSE